MTDQELRDLIAELSLSTVESTAELRRSRQEADKRQQEADKRQQEAERLQQEADKRQQEAERLRRDGEAELRKAHQETERAQEAAARQLEDAARQIKQVNKQLGELGNKFGSFTEGMAFPSMEKILYDRFKMDVVAPRATARLNGRTLEVDVMAYDNGARNEVYIVEVKSHLTRDGIEQILKTIGDFPKFFGAHRHRTIYGIIAAVYIPANLRAEVIKKGLYLARIHDGTFELLTPRAFKPEAFGPAAKQNGKAEKRASRKSRRS